MQDILTESRALLNQKADEKTRNTLNRLFKNGEEPLAYGVSVKEVRHIAKGFKKQIQHKTKQEVLEICEELWKSKYFEEAVIACCFAESLYKKYETSDFTVFEKWVETYLSNWADCDTLCNHTIGTFVMRYPEYVNELKKWSKSSKKIVRRASATTLIIPARKGLFLKDIFEIADILLLDKEDIVQKGYGWMLKAASEVYPKKVFDYVLSKKSVMPRTALRYAIEKMPAALKAEAMKRS